MDFMFDENFPLIDESWDLDAELADLFKEMSDVEVDALLELEDLPECILDAIAKTVLRDAA